MSLSLMRATGYFLESPERKSMLSDNNPGERENGFSSLALLLLFAAGAGFGGFIFAGILHTLLSPPERPVFPEPALGYTHLVKAKYGSVYGTYFEYLAVTYGLWITWIVSVVSTVLFRKIEPKSRAYPRYPWQGFAALAISIALYYAIWRLSIYAARS
jgi:hypothetical protein